MKFFGTKLSRENAGSLPPAEAAGGFSPSVVGDAGQPPVAAEERHGLQVLAQPVAAIKLPVLGGDTIRTREVSSERGNETYAVDLARYTCTCQRFKKGRAHFGERDIRRCCRHISRLLLYEKRLGKLSDFIHVMLVHRLNYGRGLWADMVRHPMRYFQIGGDDVLLVKGDFVGIEVFAPRLSGGPQYGIFGYSPAKGRWSELGMPKHHLLIMELINEWVGIGNQRIT